jgi:transposase-like protein
MDIIKKSCWQSFRPSYKEEFKHEICRKYLSGQYTKTELQQKYKIKGKSRLLTWLRTLGYVDKENNFIMKQKPPKKRKPAEKKSKQSLESALEDAKLQAAMYARMIELAEEKYKIKIRKNSDTK